MINGKTDHQKRCYLCGGTEFNKRPSSVRDRPELEVFECASCGLVFLSSFDHIRDRLELSSVSIYGKNFKNTVFSNQLKGELSQTDSKISAGQSPLLAGKWETWRSSKNGIFLIRPSYMQLMKNNLQLLANVIRSWQVSQDIENIRVIKFCLEIIKYYLLFVLDAAFYFMCRYLNFQFIIII